MPGSRTNSHALSAIQRLRVIMHTLRAPGGCPWDQEQTHESLTPHLIEEAYEVVEAIKNGDRDHFVEELGDLLLQVVFHSEIASEGKGGAGFDFDDVANAISDKLVRRHPHVFGEARAEDADAVLVQWEEIKRQEKGATEKPKHYIEKANEGLPALMAAAKLQKKAAKVGFDWPDLEGTLAKVKEELAEVEEEISHGGNQEALGEEIGDLLFAVVNVARKSALDPEVLLARTNAKFVRRFQQVEDRLGESGKTLEEATLEEMDAAWDEAKAEGH